MKEYPLLMTASNVLALLENRKDQTRRLPSVSNCLIDGKINRKLFPELDFNSPAVFIDDGPSPAGNSGPYLHVPRKNGQTMHRVYPVYAPGDKVWIKESHKFNGTMGGPRCTYRADGVEQWFEHAPETSPTWLADDNHWRPSVFLPKWAARIARVVADIRIQRLQDITESDAQAEGVAASELVEMKDGSPCYTTPYQLLWNQINGTDSWDNNPVVIVIEMKPA